MCTLTFIPIENDGFILTSNRDEAPGRNTIEPKRYQEGGTKLLFPKDELAGGTWIGVSDKKRLVCLLNGGFTAHERKDEYRMSRGILVIDLLTAKDAISEINKYDFAGIEPFTVVMIDWENHLRIFELVWDEHTIHFTEKPLAPQIWSSSLLYTSEMKQKREKWFSSFLFENLKPDTSDLLRFHKTAGEGNTETDIVMDRGFVKTKSITQIKKMEGIEMRYEDLQTNQVTHTSFLS
ncbi:NRDE family protein [Marixanthomonas sp. SCSIO 43207]|uniref:NRDE family protein n=1 Tax=Marixanthomonas sp. SCSIO 43207 TaxID=2779360 RepID=UPI001CA7DAAF|nr:NRDE family protein [Marixanthomonas sp. SCSIO 43207]UAB81440.1 NRDE family protein [Marixanthomonas sp. SCSIO 43207]